MPSDTQRTADSSYAFSRAFAMNEWHDDLCKFRDRNWSNPGQDATLVSHSAMSGKAISSAINAANAVPKGKDPIATSLSEPLRRIPWMTHRLIPVGGVISAVSSSTMAWLRAAPPRHRMTPLRSASQRLRRSIRPPTGRCRSTAARRATSAAWAPSWIAWIDRPGAARPGRRRGSTRRRERPGGCPAATRRGRVRFRRISVRPASSARCRISGSHSITSLARSKMV